LVILTSGCSISDLICRGIPETINLTLNIGRLNVLLQNDLIEIPDFEDGDSEKNSIFEPVPGNISRVINQVKGATTETKHSMKFCNICKITIKDTPVHRRTMKHLTRANENIWREFDLIANSFDETDIAIQNNDDS
jgi:hypothetical protein